MDKKICEIYQKVRRNAPLIHCITNPITMQRMADGVLAVGARPIMADNPKEVADIARSAQGLLLNLGNLTDVRMEAMEIALKAAKAQGVPVVLDLVGVSCSAFRRDVALRLLKTGGITLMKGNYSEIYGLLYAKHQSSGVDADKTLEEDAVLTACVALAKKYGCMVLASGKTDLLADGIQGLRMKNGEAQLASITGTGCLLGALCTCYLSESADMPGVATACAVLGICGELAQTEKGSGTFAVRLLDALSALSETDIHKMLDMEGLRNENI